MKSYENNMADQDVIVHSIRVLSDIKNPALSQLKREIDLTQNASAALAQRTDRFWNSLSDDGIISPLEKKIVQREMESIANSYTALYTQAVEEQYDTAPFFVDYMATYAALRDYIYSTLHLFDNMEEDTEVDREEFNAAFADYYYSENIAIVSMTVGVITDMGFKVLNSLNDPGEEGQVGVYQGSLYQYINGTWKIIDRELYYGKSAALPAAMDGRYFLCTANGMLDDALYVNDEPLEINDEILTLYANYEKGIIYVYENQHWQRKEPDEDYRYIVAMGDYYSVKEMLPAIMNTQVENIAKTVAGSEYYGPLTVPPVNPKENDFFLYSGATSSGDDPEWVFASLYMYKSGEWVRLDESVAQNQRYYMTALQDILTITESTTGYFSTVFCNAFFANQAALNALSVQVIMLTGNGVIRSEDYTAGVEGLLIDANGNIDANQNTHIGGICIIDGDATIGGNVVGDLNIAGTAYLHGRTIIEGDSHFTGDIDSGPLYLSSTNPGGKTYNYTAGSYFPEISLTNGTGSYGSTSFDKYTHTWEYSNTHTWENAEFFLNNVRVLQVRVDVMNQSRPLLQYAMQYTETIATNAKTLQLRNLPTVQPALTNCVWRDSNGFLKIT